MKVKKKIKLLTDFLLTVILLALMAYQITGEKLHECFGVSMLLLFVIHNICNYSEPPLFKDEIRMT